MSSSPDVLILGGGVIGLSCAYFLADAGLKVEVVDRQAMGREASWAGAGIIPPGNPQWARSPMDELRAFSVSQFPAFTRMLEETTGLPTGFRICGGIEFLDEESEYAIELWEEEGIAFEAVDLEQLKQLEPHLASGGRQPPLVDLHQGATDGQIGNAAHPKTNPYLSFPRKRESSALDQSLDSRLRGNDGGGFCSTGTRITTVSDTPRSPAFHFPGMAQVRNPWYLRALIAACESVGVRLRPHCPVQAWAPLEKNLVYAVLESNEEITAKQLIIATGAWANEDLKGFRTLPIHPVRGQMLLYRTKTPLLNRVIIDGKRYLVPRADGRLLVGSTEEPEAGFVKETTPEGIASLREFAETMVPALKHAELEKSWAGLRPGSADGYPTIGRLPFDSNVFAAVGHFRAGIQLSLGTAHIIRDLITGQPARFDLSPFAPNRVPNLPPRTAFRS